MEVRCPECGVDVAALSPCRRCRNGQSCCPCVHDEIDPPEVRAFVERRAHEWNSHPLATVLHSSVWRAVRAYVRVGDPALLDGTQLRSVRDMHVR